MLSWLLSIGALYGMTGVIAGAFGAHALRTKLDASQLGAYETAVQYQLLHALALLVVGIMIHLSQGTRTIIVAAWLLVIGTAFFSGSIYVLILTSTRHIGPVNIALLTPLGGSLLIAAWGILFFALIKVNWH